MPGFLKRAPQNWTCDCCGSPVPDCYALCFVCLSDERGRCIKKLEEAYDLCRQDCINLTEKVLPNVRDRAEAAEAKLEQARAIAKEIAKHIDGGFYAGGEYQNLHKLLLGEEARDEP